MISMAVKSQLNYINILLSKGDKEHEKDTEKTW